MLEISKAREEVDGEIHGTGPDRKTSHVRADQRGVRHLARDAQQAGREVDAETAGARASERPRVAPGSARDVQHPPAWGKWDGAENECHRPRRVGVVAMGIQL